MSLLRAGSRSLENGNDPDVLAHPQIPNIAMRIDLVPLHLPCLDRQFHLTDLIENHDWNFDLATGTLSFGNQHQWHTQLLGTESETSGTWLWAWANTESNILAHLLVASLALKTYGRVAGVESSKPRQTDRNRPSTSRFRGRTPQLCLPFSSVKGIQATCIHYIRT